MKGKKKSVQYGLCCVITLLTAFLFLTTLIYPAAGGTLPKRITYATQKVGTTNYATVAALCKVASEHSKMMVVVKPGAGPPAWAPHMNETGKPELGSVGILGAWWAWTGKISPRPLPGNPLGTKPFHKPNPNLRILMAGPRMSMGFLVRADSPIKSARDLKGKRVALGYLAFAAAYASLMADVYNAGLRVEDFVEVKVSGPVDGVRALIEGRVDATNAAVGMAVTAEADAKIGVRFLPGSMDPKDIKRAQEVGPGGTYEIKKAGPPGLKVDTPLWTYPIMCVTSTHLSDEIAYELLRVWTEYYKETWPLHPAFKGWGPKLMVIRNIPVPYHKGAIKFYKERGVWSAEMDSVQERLLKGEYPFLD